MSQRKLTKVFKVKSRYHMATSGKLCEKSSVLSRRLKVDRELDDRMSHDHDRSRCLDGRSLMFCNQKTGTLERVCAVTDTLVATLVALPASRHSASDFGGGVDSQVIYWDLMALSAENRLYHMLLLKIKLMRSYTFGICEMKLL